MNDGIVFGFRVDHIEGAAAELQAAGLELLCDVHRIREMNYAFCHFRGPDGRVYGINEQKSSPADRTTRRQGTFPNTRPGDVSEQVVRDGKISWDTKSNGGRSER